MALIQFSGACSYPMKMEAMAMNMPTPQNLMSLSPMADSMSSH